MALEAAESGVYTLAMTLTRNDLLSRLDALGIVTTTVDHPAVFTVEESKRLRGDLLGGHTKNLFLKDKKGRLWLVVALEDRDVDLKALRKEIGAAQLSFGKPDLLSKVLGLEPGSVTPFGVINDTGDDVLTRPPCWCTTPNLTLGPTRSCPWTDEEEVTGWSMPVPIRANLSSSRIGARHSYVPPKVPGPRSRTDSEKRTVVMSMQRPDPSSSARRAT